MSYLGLALGLVLSSAALAGEGAPSIAAPVTQSPPAASAQHDLSVTFSPLGLIPFHSVELDVNVERALGRKFSFLGGGTVGLVLSDPASGLSSPLPTLGATGQLRYYLFGTFEHGMDLAAEMNVIGASGHEGPTNVIATALNLSALAGYKLIASSGFTLDLQAGVQRRFISASGENMGTGKFVSASSQGWGPVLHLNLGWSF